MLFLVVIALVALAFATRRMHPRHPKPATAVPQWAIDVFGERDATMLTTQSAKTHAQIRKARVAAVERRFTQLRHMPVRAMAVEVDATDRNLSVRVELVDGTWLRLTRVGMTSLDSVFDVLLFDLEKVKLRRLSLEEPWSRCVLRHGSRKVELYAVGVEISSERP